MHELEEVMRAHLAQLQALQANVRQVKQAAKERTALRPFFREYLLLQMAEALIDAHKAAKIDDNGLTLDVIEDALRHVGERLAREHGVERSFIRRGVEPFAASPSR